MTHKHYGDDAEKGCGILALIVALAIGLTFWGLIIWGLYELITFLQNLNGEA